MRIAVTSLNFKTVSRHAGRSRRFLVYDSSAGVEAPALLELSPQYALHGFDDRLPHPLDGVDVLLTGSAGDGLTRRLARRNIRVVCTGEVNPRTAVLRFLEGRLPLGAAPRQPASEGAVSQAC
jgi:predicted Fe-Mo cluster-binding NifX family protein